MKGEHAELVALASHGTAFLEAGGESPDLVDEMPEAFRFVREVEFEGSTSCRAWLAERRAEGIRRFRLVALEGRDPSTSAFANAGELVIAEEPGETCWVGTWEVVDPQAPDQRIWRASYRPREGPPPAREPVSIVSASLDLAAALRDAAVLAHGPLDAGEFGGVFDDALRVLAGDLPAGEGSELLRAGAGDDARRLLGAAGQAWVFGGMGSWNDLVPEQALADDYGCITEQLFDALLDAIAAAANAVRP